MGRVNFSLNSSGLQAGIEFKLGIPPVYFSMYGKLPSVTYLNVLNFSIKFRIPSLKSTRIPPSTLRLAEARNPLKFAAWQVMSRIISYCDFNEIQNGAKNSIFLS